MTSHAKRIQLTQRIGEPYNSDPPSIISGGCSSNLSCQNGNQNYPNFAKPNLTIPENSVMSYNSSDREPMFQQRTNVKFSSGPCSSLISSKAPSLGPSIGSRLSITSEGKIKRLSQSLGGSKASLATEKSHKSTVQQEFHDIKVNRKLNALSYGRARKPFIYSLVCFITGSVFFIIGLTVILLRVYGQLFLSMDKGEIIGPIFMIAAIVLLSIGIKFVVDAYRLGAAERRRLGFRASGRNMVVAKTVSSNNDQIKTRDFIQSGTSSNQAIRKQLHAETLGTSQMGSSLR